jgi:hypothetical protein
MDTTTKYKQTEQDTTGNDAGNVLADEHWEYVHDLLIAHFGKWDSDQLAQIEFHYKTAMIHGYKHGVADCERAIESQAPKQTMDGRKR